MGYKPNTIAKALATITKPMRIGVLLNSIGNPFDKVIDGIVPQRKPFDFGIHMDIQENPGYNPTAARRLKRSGKAELMD